MNEKLINDQLSWNKETLPPELPESIIQKTADAYQTIRERLIR